MKFSISAHFFISSLLLPANITDYLTFQPQFLSQPETSLTAGVSVGCLFIS